MSIFTSQGSDPLLSSLPSADLGRFLNSRPILSTCWAYDEVLTTYEQYST